VDKDRLSLLRMVDAWFEELLGSNNESFIPLFFDEHRFLVLRGGGGSGKSIFAGRKILERVTTEPGHRWLVCRKVAKTLRESCFNQLISQANEYYPHAGLKVNKSDMLLTFENGSVIIFAGLDDVEKLKSIYGITGIWVEEASEITRDDFNQLNIRLRTVTPYYLQMILTFNPISINHWLKERFWDNRDPDARLHESTYKDNRFLDPTQIKVLEGFKDTDEYYYMVYCLNQWGVLGKSVFNKTAISKRIEAIKAAGKQPKTGYFEYDEQPDGVHIDNIRWVDDGNGPVRIYKEPEAGRPYVIGGDTAGEGSDWFVGQVLDNITGEQVCVLRHRYEEDTYARQMYCLGLYYNTALLGIETNFSTYPVKLLDLMGYRNLFVREIEDDFTGAIRQAFGFKTTQITRPVIIGELIKVMREKIGTLNDEDTLQEMLTFVRNDKLRPEAEPGANDDCVISLAIAHYIRPRQSMSVSAGEEAGTVVWTQDQWEDYNNASPGEREMLIRRWGRPRR